MADDDDNEPDDAFIAKFNKVFHKAMGDRESRLEKKLMKSFDNVLGTRFDDLRKTLVDSADDPDDVIPDQSGNPAGATPVAAASGMSPEIRAQLRRSEQAAKEASAKADKFQKQFEEEQQKRSKAEERQMLSSTLQPFVKPRLLDIAVDQVHAKNLHRDPDTGVILWKEESGETLPLKDGVAAWAKSDVGKEFAPPVEAKGRGGRGPDGGNGVITPGKMTEADLGNIITGSIPGQRS